MRVFVDSDVVISSLISTEGAAYFLSQNKDTEQVVSNLSVKEMKIVVKRMGLAEDSFSKLIKKFEKVNLKLTKAEFGAYVFDQNDSHIVAGAVKAKAKFLITYNLKHYVAEMIKKDFGIIIMTPGRFLQYLRGVGK